MFVISLRADSVEIMFDFFAPVCSSVVTLLFELEVDGAVEWVVEGCDDTSVCEGRFEATSAASGFALAVQKYPRLAPAISTNANPIHHIHLLRDDDCSSASMAPQSSFAERSPLGLKSFNVSLNLLSMSL